MRMSTSARASAATTLVRVPPEITPGFTVMPRSEVGESGDFVDLPRQLHNGARAALKIHSGVRGAALSRVTV